MRIVLSLSEIPADVSGKRDIVGVDLNEVNVRSDRCSNSCHLVIGPDPNYSISRTYPGALIQKNWTRDPCQLPFYRRLAFKTKVSSPGPRLIRSRKRTRPSFCPKTLAGDPVCSQKSRTSPLLHCHRYAVSRMELNVQCRFDTLST